jgi:hypothetical protein
MLALIGRKLNRKARLRQESAAARRSPQIEARNASVENCRVEPLKVLMTTSMTSQ